MKKIIAIVAAITGLIGASCIAPEVQPQNAQAASSSNILGGTMTGSSAQKLSGNASAIPAYYDSVIHNIHFVEFSQSAEAILIANNSSINFIYQSDNGLPNSQPFISVIDAIPGPGMNPIWREVQIVFNAGFTARQLYSDDEVLAAAAGPHAEITLTMTNEVYQCPVVGH